MDASEQDNAELLRLRKIESRLVTAWVNADAELDIESGLLRCAELRTIKRRCEIYLGYVPVHEKNKTLSDG